jgi:uncharacterized UBP type Zn finger protein
MVNCGNCDEAQAIWSCIECGEKLCGQCDADFHRPAKMKSHRRTKLASAPSRYV